MSEMGEAIPVSRLGEYVLVHSGDWERLQALVLPAAPDPGPAPIPDGDDDPAHHHWWSVRDYFDKQVGKFEGGFQNHPKDRGNWVGGRLIGTMRGIIPATYARWKDIKPANVTVDMMKAITHEDAIQVGLDLFYDDPNFDSLIWCPPTEVLVDWGWGSGPFFVIRRLQKKLGIGSDGIIGPITITEFNAFLEEHGYAAATNMISDWRWEHWDSISKPGSNNAVFREGWRWRANWYRPSNKEWWKWD